MKLLQRLLAIGLCLAPAAHAGGIEDRAAIASEFATAFARSDFARIEARYAKALAAQERTSSGRFVANTLMRSMFDRPDRNDPNWNAAEAKTRHWAAQYPQSVLAALALNRIHERRAWTARGNGYANTVTEEGWKQFGAHMDQADQVLLESADAGQADPNWWCEMLDRAREHSWPAQRYWGLASAALQAFPQNQDIYRAIGLKLVPQWGGSWRALAAFADEAVARTQETEGQILYARIYSNVSGYFGPGFLTRPEGNWPKVRAGFEELVARYPESWNLNTFASFACDAGDKATTQRILARIDDAVVPSAWANRAMYNRCRTWAMS